ncbi:MAG: PEP-utilizing enzyme [Candidatus Buchananbacteria bacterium]
MSLKLNPRDYIKLFSIKESVFLAQTEIAQRQKMKLDGFANIELIYVDGQWFFKKKDLKKYKFSDRKIIDVINLVEKRSFKYIDALKKFNRGYRGDSFSSLVLALKQSLKIWADYLRIIDIPVYTSYYFEKGLIESLIRSGFSQKDFDTLTYPLYNTYNQRRKIDLLLFKLGRISKNDFIGQWAWSNIELAAFKPVDSRYISSQLTTIKNAKFELKSIKDHHTIAVNKFNNLYAKLPAHLKKKVNVAQKLLYIRDFRFEQFLRGVYYFKPVLEAIGRKMNLSYNQLIFFKPEEVMAKKIPTDLKQRRKSYVYFKNMIFTGQKADEICRLFNEPVKNSDRVYGRPVSAGKITGCAKIVLSTREFYKIKKGDIIICEITTPDYMPILNKVSAIVADIGGFTSHSAIVARELKIPCVVGTEIGTKIFKDNDLIEVDANRGVIKKINIYDLQKRFN